MRRRITFVQPPDSPFDLDQAVLSRKELSVRQLVAAREERVTLGIEEVSDEIQDVLKQSHQLHVRWASERSVDTLAPFSSRVAAGLHVLFTPREGGSETPSLCALLKDVFDDGLKCSSPETSFITPPILSTRFASTAAYQYHALLPSLDTLVSYIQNKVCAASGSEECLRHAASLASADSLDINYDSISHALTLTGYWARSPSGGWTEKIQKQAAGAGQVEVGFLGTEKALEPEEIKMGGLLGVVGSDDQLKPTLFSFPSRHHSLPSEATYSVSFPAPTGLHPTMTISIPRSGLEPPPAPADATCALHTYLTLSSTIFGDKYQLATTDRLFLDSHHLKTLRAVAGETDLEAPDWSVARWGSNWLLELATPDQDQADQTQGDWNVTIPLHLRYLPPSESGYRTAAVPWPVVFWACTTEEGTKMGTNPFDRVNLGWDGLFGPRTMFYQLNPSHKQERLVEDLDVPVLQLKEDGFFQGKTIELGTVVIVTLGLLWVLWKLGLVVRSSGTGSQGRSRADRQKKAQ
ncbi:PIG-X-domain-containing protein [Aspergillus steynii IBT 23096]|uniref:Protein PBN1 n=1 Tax=Aspergillus steynii IBT 23096 TaxID=1392250 RepID=A0A2I2FRC4_9EURO|nr:PIG-X-domain-containing protein [Aspergillus steynii IBT 23096]PLB43188.1 PIG-X-domain-containing protein [Aspergillus steynii IBT 23096]